MFKTLNLTEEHFNKTFCVSSRTNKQASHFEILFDDRPKTTTLNTLRKPQHHNYKTLDLAELDIQNTFKKDMTLYLKRKIKHLTHKNQFNFYRDQSLNATIDNPEQSFNQLANNSTIRTK
eukprot:GHVR01043170.1.p1 GENE.GHVR01043170.1~~GHVR01043170.1.p1  ORF type:complete len:120 (+),score=4.30 GHVR01043170.1:3873-4232(+)